jgi:hypothetical protein
MRLLPEFHQVVEMDARHAQDVTDMISLRVAGLDGIPSVSQPHTPILNQFQN